MGEVDEAVAAARRDLGAAYRRLGHAVIGHHADVDDLATTAAALDRFAADLEQGPPRTRIEMRPSGSHDDDPPADGEEMLTYDDRPISGRAAPLGVDVHVARDGDEAVGSITFGAAHEGAPGRCHGGLVSALFDDVFGFVLALERRPGFTGTLNVRYEHGVPLHRRLECRVRLDRREGRKLMLSGELSGPGDDGAATVFTRATAIFVTIDPELFAITARA
ncbi:PaaI family thioesterase [Ilumatobacter sp.]|uniref:PaaI family thioesterase n=1 Tax=Ilumatobacter sp. TaxID=1967498 RepID=UPI003B526DD1